MAELLTADDAHAAILNGDTIRYTVGGPARRTDDPILLHWLDDGMILSHSIAGWSEGVTEPVCSAQSPFYVGHYRAHGTFARVPRDPQRQRPYSNR